MGVFCLHEIYTKIYDFFIIYLLTSHRWTKYTTYIIYSYTIHRYIISETDLNNNKIHPFRRRKFTVGIIVAETAGCVSDISVQFNTFLYYTSFVFFLQVLYFYNPQICALNHAYFFTSVLTLWFMLSIYFPSLL